MGVFGHGNFDSDTALDWFSDFNHRFLNEIREIINNSEDLQPDEFGGDTVPCQIEVLCALSEKLAEKEIIIDLPEVIELENWKSIYMKVWDENIDGLKPTGENQKEFTKRFENHKTERRKVLIDTFDRIIALAKKIKVD